MMNKSSIPWCDFSWSPITGCMKGCPYCFAEKITHRFAGDIRMNLGDQQIHKCDNGMYILEKPFKNSSGKVLPYPAGFAPTFHKYRLPEPAQKKKPANIFVCAMSDLWGDWIPDSWLDDILIACEKAPQHNYMFLTKNPKRYYDELSHSNLSERENFWYGTTVTRATDPFFWSNKHKTFLSIEPLLEDLHAPDVQGTISSMDWIIVGAETGIRKDKVTPERKWIEDIVNLCHSFHIPIFLKPSKEMEAVWGEDLIQEWPKELLHEEKIIPHCEECEYCSEKEYHGGISHFCEKLDGKHIEARYARTSPEWCPMRKG